MQPFVGFIAGNGTPLTVTKTDEVRRVGEDEINGVIRDTGHNIDAVTEDKTGHTKLLLLQRAPGGHPCGARSPLPVGCSPRPVTGQADRGIPQPSSF
uniref:Uncharacterized protein n=1 Tax=Escherichia coli TaxID=562 RepID=A0A6G9I187_ECOLX|nr:hypothetical protein pIP72_140 [Escherichia coli]